MEKLDTTNIVEDINRLSLLNPISKDPMLRNSCRNVNVVCNYKKITTNSKNFCMRIHSIKFDPEIIGGGKLCYTIIGALRKQIYERVGQFMQQGMTILSTQKLDEPFELSLEACKKSNNIAYKITISPTNNSFDFGNKNEDANMLRQKKIYLEKIFSSILNANGNLVRFNNKCYCDFSLVNTDKISDEPYIIPGYNTSVVVSQYGAYLRICAKNKMINNRSCLQVLKNLRNKDDIISAFQGKSLLANYGNKKVYRVDDIAFDKNVVNTTITVRNSEGKEEINLKEYYRRAYNKNITDNNQPLFVMKKKTRNGEESEIYLVPELMLPTGIDESTKQSEGFNKGVNRTRLRPIDKMNQLKGFFNYLASKISRTKTRRGKDGKVERKLKTADEVRESWGIGLATEFEEIRARELLAPQLNYLNGPQEVNQGKFRTNKAIEAKVIGQWGYICERCDDGVTRVLDNMKKASEKVGLTLSSPKCFELGNSRGWADAIKERKKEFDGLSLIVVMLQNNHSAPYKTVKEIFYQRLGIPCQCLVISKQSGGNLSSITNVLNQMVVKCNGRLYNIELKRIAPKMGECSCLLGVEVCKVGKGRKYSIVSTINSYHNKLSVNEYIVDQGDDNKFPPINQFINSLFEIKLYPKTIIIYRNGSNASQNKMIMNEDILPLRRFIDEKFKEEKSFPKPKIAFIIVNKLTDVKFFQKENNSNLANPQSGLCVDDIITSPGIYEFYIQPQYVNQGTASPTKFQVLMDDTDLKLEEVEQITYYMCYYYWNWSGAIRVPSVLKFSEVCSKFSSTNLIQSMPVKDKISRSPYFI